MKRTAHRNRSILSALARRTAAAAAALVALAVPALGAQATIRTDHITAEVTLADTAVAPGDSVEIAIRQIVEDGWHTYWENPGDSGAPTLFGWTLPDGAEPGEIRWPTPELMPYPPLLNYGYSGEITYLTSITVPSGWTAGEPLPVSLEIDWLVCSDICIPESGTTAFEIPTAAASEADSSVAFTFLKARRALPETVDWPASLSGSADDLRLVVEAEGIAPDSVSDAYFFPLDPDLIDHSSRQSFAVEEGDLVLTLRPQGATEPGMVRGVLALTDASGKRTGYRLAVDGPASAIPAPAATAPPASASGPGSTVGSAGNPGVASLGGGSALAIPAEATPGLWRAILFALLGGLILNLMPCVFPVLALKAVAFAGHGHEPVRSRIAQGGAYTAGILVSFLVLAGGLIALKAGGAAVGWGFQLQQPIVVAILAYVLVLVGLNLSGLYEIGLGMTRAGGLVHGSSGTAGSFFTGVLAAVVATPCTAPFMAVAIGYALTQGAALTLAVFAALGLGLALPFLVVSLMPAVGRLLPRPGVWMVRFRQILAFPLYATAAWLVWVLAQQAGVDAMFAVLVGCVLLGFAAWAIGLRQGGLARGRWAAGLAALVGLAGAVALLSPSLATEPPVVSMAASNDGTGLNADGSLPFSPDRLAALRAEGKPVFLNVTAAWCITCKVNERVAFRQDFREALARDGVTFMTADWTRRDPAITSYLERYGRAGVPLYLVFPRGDGGARVLPQILTEAMLVDALNDAASG
ncbi:protein-disulfide reductase DsbD family protein [Amorphus coralli]|uniref:protein-disulfide reductase DsbD family protein n=1 Tax=Amorphus coralli TaxID=340680 RepID=UPI0003697850|nr:protein-disulfide reductase DsbD domain-containing protein [Amorphus coralli]